MELKFDPIKHIYTLDGEVIPSVTDLTRFIHNEIYGNVPAHMLRQSMSKGKAVNAATAELDRSGKASIRSDCAGYLQAYAAFKKEHEVSWSMIDEQVHYKNYYAGTLDRVGMVDGRKVLLTISTASNLGRKLMTYFIATLSLYWLAAPNHSDISAQMVLQLRSDGTYRLREVPCDAWLAYLCLVLNSIMSNSDEICKGGFNEFRNIQ